MKYLVQIRLESTPLIVHAHECRIVDGALVFYGPSGVLVASFKQWNWFSMIGELIDLKSLAKCLAGAIA